MNVFRILVLLTTFLQYCSIGKACNKKNNRLRFNKDGSFKILQLSDMHLMGPNDNTYGQDEKTINLMIKLIKEHKPDVVAVTGDLTHGWCCDPKYPGEYHSQSSQCFSNDENKFDWFGAFKKAILPMEQLQVPYFITLGNHDHPLQLGVEFSRRLVEADMRNNCSLTQYSETLEFGITDFNIEVFSSQAKDEVAYVLSVLDSRTSNPYPQQLCNYLLGTKKYKRKKEGKIPSMVFQHISPIEMNDLYTCSKPHTYFCINFDGGAENLGTMSHLYHNQNVDVVGLFTGHHHDNNNCGTYNPQGRSHGGISTCLTRSVGYCNNHGPSGTNGNLGGRVITIFEGMRKFKSELVFENSSFNEAQSPPYAPLLLNQPYFHAPCTMNASFPNYEMYNSVDCSWRG